MPPVGASERLPLFVCGTLRHGHENHRYLDGHFEQMVPASLPGYARLHPLMIIPAREGTVDGELSCLNSFEYGLTLAGCDELEEIPLGQLAGHEYERRRVTVVTRAGDVTAWAYVQTTVVSS